MSALKIGENTTAEMPVPAAQMPMAVAAPGQKPAEHQNTCRKHRAETVRYARTHPGKIVAPKRFCLREQNERARAEPHRQRQRTAKADRPGSGNVLHSAPTKAHNFNGGFTDTS